MHKILKQISLIILTAFLFTVGLGGSGWGEEANRVNTIKLIGIEGLNQPLSLESEGGKEIRGQSFGNGNAEDNVVTLKQKAGEAFKSRMINGLLNLLLGFVISNGSNSEINRNTGTLFYANSFLQYLTPSEEERELSSYSAGEKAHKRYKKEKEDEAGMRPAKLGLGALVAAKFLERQYASDGLYGVSVLHVLVDVYMSFVVGEKIGDSFNWLANDVILR